MRAHQEAGGPQDAQWSLGVVKEHFTKASKIFGNDPEPRAVDEKGKQKQRKGYSLSWYFTGVPEVPGPRTRVLN